MAKKLTTEEFIEKAKKKHGDAFTYESSVYKNSVTKLVITCPSHGDFEQTPNSHLNGSGCPDCSGAKISESKRMTTEEFITKSRAAHGGRYDYSESEYHGCFEKVKISCQVHGAFEQTASNHIAGSGCPDCVPGTITSKLSSNTEEFVAKAKKTHGGRYKYESAVYVNNYTDVVITCPTHGEFTQSPHNHLSGKGCSKCSGIGPSKVENEIFSFVSGLVSGAEQSNRTVLNGKELDVLCADQRVAIEFDGLYWHSSGSLEDDKRIKGYHLQKTEMVETQGIRLYHIFENEWYEKSMAWQSVLCNALGKSPDKVYARQCKVVEVDPKTARQFQEDNHLQGSCPSTVRLGLEFKGELVSLMTFGRPRYNKDHEWELLRFCSLIFTNVVGGASRLLSHFKKTYGSSIITYANRRWSDGGLYRQLGFTEIGIGEPSYYYFENNTGKLYHRSSFMKHKLKDKLETFNPSLTEVENMYANGYRRIWDCGSKVYSML